MNIALFPRCFTLLPVMLGSTRAEIPFGIPVRHAVHLKARGIQYGSRNERRVAELREHFFFAPPLCNLFLDVTAIKIQIFRDQKLGALLPETRRKLVQKLLLAHKL